jgi:hypothetical protein
VIPTPFGKLRASSGQALAKNARMGHPPLLRSQEKVGTRQTLYFKSPRTAKILKLFFNEDQDLVVGQVETSTT